MQGCYLETSSLFFPSFYSKSSDVGAQKKVIKKIYPIRFLEIPVHLCPPFDLSQLHFGQYFVYPFSWLSVHVLSAYTASSRIYIEPKTKWSICPRSPLLLAHFHRNAPLPRPRAPFARCKGFIYIIKEDKRKEESEWRRKKQTRRIKKS